MKNDNKKICIMCGKQCENGIMINGNIICKECESNIVNSEINTENYEYFKRQIKERIGEMLTE